MARFLFIVLTDSVCLQGEKYLILKKKYRQMLHERDAKHPGTDGDGQRHSSPARTPATAQWDTTDASTSSSSPRHQKEQQDEREPDGAAEVSAAALIDKIKTAGDDSATTLAAKMQTGL